MTKILYIEDNIDAGQILIFFKKILTKDLRDEIEDTNSTEELLEVISKSNKLDVCTDFIKALNIIKEMDKYSYDLIILDRDLYSTEDKRKIGNYNESLLPEDFDKKLFFLREGDYLITILHKKIDIDKQLYFLSGNNDDIREKAQFEYLLSEEFKKNNILSKERRDNDRLKEIINNNLCVKYDCGEDNELKPYIEILVRYIDENAISKFIELKKYKDDSSQIEGNLVRLRKLLQSYIIKTIVKNITKELELKVKYPNESEGIKIGFYPKDKDYSINTIYEFKYIKENILMTGNSINMSNSKKYISKKFKMIKKIKSNQLMLDYPWSILSELIHDDKLSEDGENFIKDTDRAINTINILYYQLKEIILWFDQVMKEID